MDDKTRREIDKVVDATSTDHREALGKLRDYLGA